jgi:hypothetical protein
MYTSKMESRLFEIWSEGYDFGGSEKVKARYWGCETAKSFSDACRVHAKMYSSFEKYFNDTYLEWWGCRLYDNEGDARRRFG